MDGEPDGYGAFVASFIGPIVLPCIIHAWPSNIATEHELAILGGRWLRHSRTRQHGDDAVSDETRKNDDTGEGGGERFGGCMGWLFRRLALAGFVLLLLVYLIGLALNAGKGEMKGMNVSTSVFAVGAEDVELLFDTTGVDGGGERVCDHRIFDRLLEMVESADDVIILDMFLVNRFKGNLGGEFHRDTSKELVDALVRRKREKPELFILFLTDPINAFYEFECPPVLEPLADAGGCIVLTDLLQLSDSNLLYSPFYRSLRYLGPVTPFGRANIFSNPFDGEADGFSWFQLTRLLNFKANHRKVAVVHTMAGDWVSLVTSANPHSGSSAHGNVGMVVLNGPSQAVAGGELDIARASVLRRPELSFGALSGVELVRKLERLGERLDEAVVPADRSGEGQGGVGMVQYLTERAVFDKTLWLLDDAGRGDRVDLAMFYLSDSKVVERLKRATSRGAELRLLLDPNKDAFGRQKNGIPNRAVAADIVDWADDMGIPVSVRWFDTHGEQAHYKLLHVRSVVAGRSRMILGSSNFTPRNLRGKNLESGFYVESDGELGRQCDAVFNRLWSNDGARYSVDYKEYASTGFKLKMQKLMTGFGNATGFCTW
jgi:hypothetical protein